VNGRPIVVAIDGPAGTGKSTVARQLAVRLGLPYLDTGSMYRALALLALRSGVDVDDPQAMEELAKSADLRLMADDAGTARVWLEGRPVDQAIRRPEVAAATSRLAVHPGVRRHMVELQRRFVADGGGVLEGRDIGTRVVPETRLKFFLDAAPDVRAQRRADQMVDAGETVDRASVEAEIRARDERDRSRVESPLAPAADAQIIDTSRLAVDEVLDLVIRRIRDLTDAST